MQCGCMGTRLMGVVAIIGRGIWPPTQCESMTPSDLPVPLRWLPASIARRVTGKNGLVIFGAGARAFALGSQLIVLLIMSWMLPK